MEHEDRLKAALADSYPIEREIGSGGMATVYLAEDLKHERKVALKIRGTLGPGLVANVTFAGIRLPGGAPRAEGRARWSLMATRGLNR